MKLYVLSLIAGIGWGVVSNSLDPGNYELIFGGALLLASFLIAITEGPTKW